jgi:threonine aldolase
MTATETRTVDLRSDTVTHPSPAMREAIFRAELGDDVLGDDPTVKKLEAMAAERLGKEAALYVPSGTMANLVSTMVHCEQRGDEAIVGSMSHLLQIEQAGAAALGGVQLRAARNEETGHLDLAEVRASVRPRGLYQPRTAMIAIENTHNACNGSPLSAAYSAEVARIAHDAGAAFHIDGARIFNAAIALETTPAELSREADSVTFCLSKGLACPIGSLICGSANFIEKCRRQRRMVGGGMRQIGILAAPGIVALEEMVDRLADDHLNARMLAEGLATIPGISARPDLAKTNIVFFTLDQGIDPGVFRERAREKGVLYSGGPIRWRMVTHYGVEREDIEAALEAMQEVAQSLA